MRSPTGDQMAEIQALLNDEAARRERRRRPHHLPPEAYATTDAVYCITLCARHQGAPFEVAPVALGVVGAMRFYRDRGLCFVYAYCLMPDHLHAVLQLAPAPARPEEPRSARDEAPLVTLKRLISRFKSYTTSQIAWKHGLEGPLWQRDFYDHIGRNPEDIENQCRYTLDNPVRKELVRSWEQYPWSGILDEW